MFKKNAENFKAFFNFSIVLLTFSILLSRIKYISSSFGVWDIVAAAFGGIILMMTGIMVYLSQFLTKKTPLKTVIFMCLYFLMNLIYFEFDYMGESEGNLEKSVTNILFLAGWIGLLRILMFRQLLILFIPLMISFITLKVFLHKWREVVYGIFFLLWMMILTLINIAVKEMASRRNFNYERSLNHEIKRTQALL